MELHFFPILVYVLPKRARNYISKDENMKKNAVNTEFYI